MYTVTLALMITMIVFIMLYGSIIQPLSNSFITYNFEDRYELLIKDNIDFDMYEWDFLDHVKDNYDYNALTTDCKFYSMLWHEYFAFQNWSSKFVYTDNHVFIVAWKDSLICIADIDMLDCKVYSGFT